MMRAMPKAVWMQFEFVSLLEDKHMLILRTVTLLTRIGLRLSVQMF